MNTRCSTSTWLPLSIGLGAALGAATGAMPGWVAVGAAAGVLLEGLTRPKVSRGASGSCGKS